MPKIVDHDRYRKELLGKCFDLFAAKGYGSITMREIAQGLGVSTGTLYHYFPNKKVLFEQLIEQMAERDVIMGLVVCQLINEG
jgi:AcrR family transcriptional regulator